MPIKKDIIYIKLAKSPLAIKGNVKHSTNSDGIYHGTKSLVKVNARLLVKAFSNKASFISCNKVVRIFLNVKHPFVFHYILPRSWGNQSLSIFSDESIIFFLHRPNPLGILESMGDSAWFRDSWNDGGDTIFRVGFEDGIFKARFHVIMV